MLGVSSTETIDSFFSSTIVNTQANLDALAGTVLSQGIDFYQKGDYSRAINSFRRSAALSPYSDNTAKAYDYMGLSYLKQEKTDEAIKVYQEAIRLYPTHAEFQVSLGDIYQAQDRQEDALKAYEAAVNLDSSDAEARYSLGQSYITAGRLDEAREQFNQVIRLTPSSAAGFYGLGQTGRAAGNYQAAISQLNKAIKVNSGFEKAYVELAYTYADMGDFPKASEQVSVLSAKASSQTSAVQNYITGAAQPKIIAAQSTNGFDTTLGSATMLSELDSSLATAGNSKLFSMNFAFSKDMDQLSVLDHNNWRISRATVRENSGFYNGGLTPPQTEAVILSQPLAISYDTETNTATIQFRLSQNAGANATIDPAHIVFKFYGLDAYGKAMDTSADEYSGFSKIV